MGDHSDQIGEQLRKAREDAGLSMADAISQTRLPRSAIEALESENFAHFASPVYAKSFLSQYSGFLNVEATQWLDALKPSAFIEGDPLLSLLNSADAAADDAPSIKSRGGWMPVIGLLAVSGGIVLGAIELFDFFDERFGVDLRDQIRDESTRTLRPGETAPAAMGSPGNPMTPDPASQVPHDDAVRQTPRSMIVR